LPETTICGRLITKHEIRTSETSLQAQGPSSVATTTAAGLAAITLLALAVPQAPGPGARACPAYASACLLGGWPERSCNSSACSCKRSLGLRGKFPMLGHCGSLKGAHGALAGLLRSPTACLAFLESAASPLDSLLSQVRGRSSTWCSTISVTAVASFGIGVKAPIGPHHPAARPAGCLPGNERDHAPLPDPDPEVGLAAGQPRQLRRRACRHRHRDRRHRSEQLDRMAGAGHRAGR
jgi:hypothetical protein